MNAKDSYEVHVEARRARALLQAELLSRAAAVLAERARGSWEGLVTTHRRRPRLSELGGEIVES